MIWKRRWHVLLMVLTAHQSFAQDVVLQPFEMRSDLDFIQSLLHREHPGTYLYRPIEDVDNWFDSTRLSLDHPMSVASYYRAIAPLNSFIMDGHTFLLKEDHELLSDFTKVYFPYELMFNGEAFVITKVFGADSSVAVGDVIDSINHRNTSDIANIILKGFPRDGHNATLPLWMLEHYFREFFYLHFGPSLRFDVCLHRGDSAWKHSAVALNRYGMSEVYASRTEPGIALTHNDTTDFYLLRLPSFYRTALRQNYGQRFKPAVRAAFKQLRQEQAENLVLDLRGNQGGQLSNGKFLLRRLVAQPTHFVDRMYMNKTIMNADGTPEQYEFSLNRYRYIDPHKHAFKGKVYVLCDGGTFSCASAVASVLNQQESVVLVGMETGGGSVQFGGNIKSYTLPYSRLRLEVPRVRFETDHPGKEGRGVFPDVLISRDRLQQFDHEDPFLTLLDQWRAFEAKGEISAYQVGQVTTEFLTRDSVGKEATRVLIENFGGQVEITPWKVVIDVDNQPRQEVLLEGWSDVPSMSAQRQSKAVYCNSECTVKFNEDTQCLQLIVTDQLIISYLLEPSNKDN